MPTQPARTCPTYNYWHDLKTDLRKPESWLDFANMILRRFRLILVKTGDEATWRLRFWLTFLDEIHAQGRCERCNPTPTNWALAFWRRAARAAGCRGWKA